MFYETMRKLCFDNDIRMTTLARKVGVSPSSPRRWKEGSIPRGDTLQKIADLFGVTTDYLIYGDDRQTNTVNNSGSVHQSSVVVGGVGSKVTMGGAGQQALTDDESELLEIFRALDRKRQIAVLGFAYEQEDAAAGGKKEED